MIRVARLALGALCLTAPAEAQRTALTGTILVTNKTPATVTLVDAASGAMLATLPTGAGPHEIVMLPDARTAVVTDYGAQMPGHTLTVIDVPSLRVVRTIDLGGYRRPHGIVALSNGRQVAVTSETEKAVLLVNVADGTIARAVSTAKLGSHMVGVVRDDTRGWTGDIGSNTITELDLVGGNALRSIDVPLQPEAINVTPDGREVWVGSNATGRVSVVNTASGAVTTAAEGFGWPYRVLFTPDDAMVLLPDYRKEELRFVDRTTKAEVARLAFPGGGPQGITLANDGRVALLSLSSEGTVALIDVAGRRESARLPVGDTPDGVAYTPHVVRAPTR